VALFTAFRNVIIAHTGQPFKYNLKAPKHCLAKGVVFWRRAACFLGLTWLHRRRRMVRRFGIYPPTQRTMGLPMVKCVKRCFGGRLAEALAKAVKFRYHGLARGVFHDFLIRRT
jgi:hypothetical protein